MVERASTSGPPGAYDGDGRRGAGSIGSVSPGWVGSFLGAVVNGSYRIVVTDRAFVTGLIAVMLSAIALGMVPLVLILASPAGSLATAAVAAGAFGIGNALGVPAQGALLARFPVRAVLGASGCACCALLVGAAAMTGAAASQAVVLFCAGAAFPAITAAFRAWVPQRFTTQTVRTSAYALLSVAFQAGLAAGPVLAAMAMASALRPYSVSVVAVLAAGATLSFTASRGTIAGATPKRPASTATRAGVPKVLRLVVIGALVSVGTGALTAVVPAAAAASGARSSAGLILACLAVGEAVGALVFGAMRLPGSERRHLVVALSLILVGYLSLSMLLGALPAIAGGVFVIGALSSPVTIVLSSMLDDLLPPALIAGAYGAVVAAAVAGAAMGTGTAGLLLGSPLGITGAVGAAAVGVCLAITLSIRRISPPDEPGSAR